MKPILYLLLALMWLPSCDQKKPAVVDAKVEPEPDHAGHDSIYVMTRYADQRVKDVGWKVRGLREGTWRHYNSDATMSNIGYYYKGKRVADMDIDDFHVKSVVRNGVFVMLPTAWEKSKDADDFLTATKYTETSSPNFLPIVKIMKMEDAAVAELDEYGEATIKQITKKHPDFKLLSTRKYNIGNNEAYEIFALMTVGDTKAGYLGTYIKHGTELYFFTCMAEDGGHGHFLKYLGVFRDIVESVNFQ